MGDKKVDIGITADGAAHQLLGGAVTVHDPRRDFGIAEDPPQSARNIHAVAAFVHVTGHILQRVTQEYADFMRKVTPYKTPLEFRQA